MVEAVPQSQCDRVGHRRRRLASIKIAGFCEKRSRESAPMLGEILFSASEDMFQVDNLFSVFREANMS